MRQALPCLPVRLVVPLVLLALACPSPAQAWVAGPDRPHHADLAVLAAQRLPEPERALIFRNLDAFRAGALDPDGVTDPSKNINTFYHAYEPHDGGGGGVYRVRLSLHHATMALREGAPEADAAYQLGVLTHFTLDLAMPFHTGADDYDHAWHESTEKLAYDHRGDLAIPPGGPPREVADPGARAVALAEASAALSDPLIAELDASGGAWTPGIARILGEAAALGVAATADHLHTAFLWADPARPAPEPVHEGDLPVPRDAEDLGLSLTELWRKRPTLMLALVFSAAAALLSLGAYALARRRGGAHG